MKMWSISFRIWHWIHAFVVLSLLATVFLRKTFLSWRANSEILASNLLTMDVDITGEQAEILAKAVRSPMWEWHIMFGYALSLLIFIRMLLFFTTSGKQNFINLKSLNLHKKMVSLGYIGIYSILVFMSISGLIMSFHEELFLVKETVHDIKEVHEFVFNAVWIFVSLHIAGLIVAENTDEKGIVSDMINGGK
ncbi:cytochrome b/b6 domain-containing protein [Sulfurimonas sp. MAG313]|nr:cytochrome b/b6 domain-containing protein [Sulfurimonas sp. MAG313]MDF1880240.1 cytochrome b/b6 domain-containing protein [Sulfurimonas sp. MAG313]